MSCVATAQQVSSQFPNQFITSPLPGKGNMCWASDFKFKNEPGFSAGSPPEVFDLRRTHARRTVGVRRRGESGREEEEEEEEEEVKGVVIVTVIEKYAPETAVPRRRLDERGRWRTRASLPKNGWHVNIQNAGEA